MWPGTLQQLMTAQKLSLVHQQHAKLKKQRLKWKCAWIRTQILYWIVDWSYSKATYDSAYFIIFRVNSVPALGPVTGMIWREVWRHERLLGLMFQFTVEELKENSIISTEALTVMYFRHWLGLWRWQIFTTAVVMDQLPPVVRCCVYLYI